MMQSDTPSSTVFVVDGDADVRESIADLLKSEGLRAEDGRIIEANVSSHGGI